MRFLSNLHDAWHRHHGAHHPHEHHHHRHGIGRGHRGFAGFGGRHGFGDALHAGMADLQRGRKLGSADLQLLLLALLAERPSHGYELIKALDERSRGYYQPSPGMVYPALTYLEEIGYASVESEGAKKLYSVTVAGLAHLDEQRAQVDALLAQLAYLGERMEQMRQAMAGRDDGDEAAGFEAPSGFFGRGRHGHGSPELRAARHALKAALGERSGGGLDDERRIARILERAAADIRAGAPASAGTEPAPGTPRAKG